VIAWETFLYKQVCEVPIRAHNKSLKCIFIMLGIVTWLNILKFLSHDDRNKKF
jgi:hypothetical protein